MMKANKLMMLDEPTAALGVHQTHTTLEVIRSVAKRGIGVLVISHSMDDVFAVADRIIVLRLGQVVLDCAGRRDDDRARRRAHHRRLDGEAAVSGQPDGESPVSVPPDNEAAAATPRSVALRQPAGARAGAGRWAC